MIINNLDLQKEILEGLKHRQFVLNLTIKHFPKTATPQTEISKLNMVSQAIDDIQNNISRQEKLQEL